MYRFLRNVRQTVGEAIDRIHSFLPLSATQLLWALGAVALLLPATAYAWWRHNPVASSLTVNEQDTTAPTLKLNQTAPATIKTNYSSSSSDSSANTTEQTTLHSTTPQTHLQVNGQTVPLPSHGSVHKEIKSKNGKTTLDVSVDSNSAGVSHSNTSTNIELNSSTESVSNSGD